MIDGLSSRISFSFEVHCLDYVDLADRLTLSPDIVHAWIIGKYEPSLQQLKAISEATDVSADYLLGLSDDPFPFTTDSVSLDGLTEDQVEAVNATIKAFRTANTSKRKSRAVQRR